MSRYKMSVKIITLLTIMGYIYIKTEMRINMNITLDTQYSSSYVTDTDNTTTYKTTAEPTRVWGSGYSLDIADKVMDDKAYQGHGLTAQDIMSKAENTNVQAQKDFMIVMSNSVSGEDYEKMQEDGFRADKTDVETYVSIVDRIKVTLAKAGIQISGYNDDLDTAIVEEITGSHIDANELMNRMQQADLPVTKENVEALTKTIASALSLGTLTEDAMKYMLINQKAPTIDNLYLAQFSSAAQMRQAKGYYSDYGQGYYAKKADSYNWDNLQSGIDAVIKQSGLDDTEETRDNAKWLVESGIELNTQNLSLVSELKELELPMEPEKIMVLAVNAMHNGKQPGEALATGEMSIEEQAAQIIEDVANISEEAIHETVESGEVINLKNLTAAQKEIDARQETGKVPEYQDSEEQVKPAKEFSTDHVSLREIEARRQLEEIRLMMTEDANRQLLRNGIQIDTTELSQLVEALKVTESNMRATLFHGDTAEINATRALWYEDTLAKTKELASMPAALIGKLTADKTSYTLETVHEVGLSLRSKYEKAGETYEALMTAPRKDMGDNIQKAFRNVDDILDDMKLELNDINRRAVRILGYNNMEITREHIDAVKQADSQVTGVIRRMTPATTLQMIREQINPLEMSLDELDNYLNEQNKDTGDDAEKYSKYLHKLDKSHSITEEEREAYIGIYRLFRQIEKSDGAVIGSVVAAGAQMNFKNMLSAVRSSHNKDINIAIDDSFGGLEDMIAKGKAIDAQIMTGYQNHESNQNQNSTAEQEKYYARLSGEIKEELAEHTSAESLQSLDIRESTTIEQFAGDLKQANATATDDKTQKQERLHDFQQKMQSVQEIEDAVIQSLIDYEQPVSISNIEAASLLLMERGSLYKQIFGRSGAASTENDTAVNDAFETIGDAEEDSLLAAADRAVEELNDRKSAVSAYKELVEEASRAVESMVHSSDSVIDVKAAQVLYKGLTLAGSLAKEENYEIPVNIKGEITSVNLKIYRNSSKIGKVAVTMDTESLGKVAADFDVTDNRVSGMIAYDKKLSGGELEELKNSLEEKFVKAHQEEGMDKTISVSLVETKALDLNKFGQDRDIEESERLSTKELYQTAKAFITALKEMHTEQERIIHEN